MKNALNAAFIYVAVILGAGFASGREVIWFFGRFGFWGIFGIVISSVIIGFVGAAVLEICAEEKTNSYAEFMKSVLGGFWGKITGVVANIFVFVLFSAMLAGTGSLVKEMFALPPHVGIIAGALLCFAALLSNVKGILKLNAYLAPILIFGGVFVGLSALSKITSFSLPNSVHPGGFAVSGVIYASYNVITAITVLACMSVPDKKTARQAGVLAGVFVCALCLTFCLPLMFAKNDADMPMLAITFGYTRILYFAVLAAAIFSTAASNAFAAAEWLKTSFKLDKTVAALTVCVIGAIGANFGFSSLVSGAYTLFGYFGLFEVAAVICKYFKINPSLRREENE